MAEKLPSDRDPTDLTSTSPSRPAKALISESRQAMEASLSEAERRQTTPAMRSLQFRYVESL
jgi:hypothetical protein